MSALKEKLYAGVKFLLALGAACFLTAAFASYHSEDPSFNTASGLEVQNWMGKPGSYVSDLLFQGFGAAALLIPLFIFFWCGFYAREKRLPLFKTRLFAFVLLLLVAGTLFSSFGKVTLPGFKTERDLGGIPGSYLYSLLPFNFWVTASFYAVSAVLFAFCFKFPLKALFRLCFLRGKKVKKKGEDGEKTSQKYSRLFSVLSVFGMKKRSKVPMPEEVLVEKKEPVFGESLVKEKFKKALKEDKKVKSGKKVADVKGRSSSETSLTEEKGKYVMPPVDFLMLPPSGRKNGLTQEAMEKNAKRLESILEEFGVKGSIVHIQPGPVVTLYELELSAGIKTSRVIGLAEDIARVMSVISVRIAVIPGRSEIGIEMPNEKRETVYLRELIDTTEYRENKTALPLILGKDIAGTPVFANLASMPHLLVAGTTGSGKSVAINTMILSLLYRFTPKQCRMIMIDPKRLELSVYNGIPHLMIPVVTEAPKAVMALKWAVREMEDRYRAMSQMGVRNIENYNAKLREALATGKTLTRSVQTGFDPETGRPVIETQQLDLTPLPYIVIIVDEMADLMLVAGKDVEAAIQRLAQMARAAGLHLIMATQRPSVDVITGTIKANFPTRISFQVTSKIDSRTILGEQGAEQLLGKGDMLFMAAGQKPRRVHGPFVSDDEVEKVVSFWAQQGEPDYVTAIVDDQGADVSKGGSSGMGMETSSEENSLYDQAVNIVIKDRKASTSYIQRQLKIGYNRAADLMDRMEAEGVVSSPNATGRREVLVPDPNEP